MFKKNEVVQFTENHKWCGCLGIIDKVKQCGDDVRYMIGVPIPDKGTAFIFSMESAKEFELIGMAVMAMAEEGDDED